MWNRLFAENPFLLIYQGRLRRQRKMAWLGTAAASLFIGWLTWLSFQKVGVSLSAMVLTGCLCFFGWAQNCVAQTVMGLGQNGNLEEMVPANLPPATIADSATAFLARRWLKLTPFVVLGALLQGQLTATGIILALWLLILPGGCCSVYASTVQLLLREGQVPWSRVLAMGLRGVLLALMLMIPLAFCTTPGQFIVCGLLVIIPLNLHGMLESRRLVVDWLTQPQPQSQSRQRAGSSRPAWMVGAAANPLLFRYEVTRRQWFGVPAWLIVSLLLGVGLSILSVLCLPLTGVMAFYLLIGASGFGSHAHLRYLHQEMRNGNYEIVATALRPREVSANLAQVGYLPRFVEMVPASLIFVLTLAATHIQQAGSILLMSLGLAAWWLVQARISAYLNVFCALALRHQPQLSLLHSVAAVAQLSAIFLPLILPGLVNASLASSNLPGDFLATTALTGFGLTLALFSYLIPRGAARLAR